MNSHFVALVTGFLPTDGSILIGGINGYFVSVVLALHGFDRVQ